MKILLDENFPLALLPRLREEGRETEHLILLGMRGISDSVIIERLKIEDLLFLTNDREFLQGPPTRSAIIVSRVNQSLPIEMRIEIWLRAIREFFARNRGETLFEVFDDGKLLPCDGIRRSDS
jgi:predicted nuclease of predicted toxin-antitoxin system